MSNKKVLSKIDLGKYTKPNPFHKDIIYDPKGQWDHPGQNTRIPGGDITMQGVPYPVYARPNVGQPQMMYPDQNYQFPGADYVDEFPQMKKGGRIKGLVSMPKPSKKGLMSNKYSRSLDATNKLFTENFLFAKPKSRKNKVFDPNANYAKGGQSNVKHISSKDGVETPIYKKVDIKPSKIHGNGLFTKEAIKKNEAIGICHVKNKGGQLIPSNILGMYNHNKKTPNVYEINKGNHVVMMPLRDISPGEELTADYDMVPIKGLQDSSSFKKGGALLTKKVTCKKCGWEWDAADGGKDIMSCHKCPGKGLVKAAEGGENEDDSENEESGCPQGYYWNGTKCIKVPRNAFVTSDADEYSFRKAAYDDSLWMHQNNKRNPWLWKAIKHKKNGNWLQNAIAWSADETRSNIKNFTLTPQQFKKGYKAKIKEDVITRFSNNTGITTLANAINDQDHSTSNTFYYRDPYVLTQDAYKFDSDHSPIRRNNPSIPFNEPISYLGKKATYTDNINQSGERVGYIETRYKKPVQPVVYDGPDKKPVKVQKKVLDKQDSPTTRTVYVECPPGSVSNGEKTEVITHDPDSPGNYLRTITTGCAPEKIENLPLLKPSLIQQQKYQLQGNPLNEEELELPNEEVESEYLEPGSPDTENAMEWVDKRKYNIDWNGIQIPYRLPRFRKPGSYGDLIKPGKKRYINLPTIESRNTAYLREEQYGGENDNPPDKVQDLNEVTVYGNQEKIKLQGSLIDRLKQVKKAYNDHRVNLGLQKQKQSAEGTSSIISLKDQIQSYKKELNEEKKSYDKASKALNVLKKYNPESYKKAKVSDVLNSTGVDDLRNLYKEGKISDATFMDFYDSFGKSYDREATRTTEEDQVKLEDSWYGKPDEMGRTRWMDNPNNVSKVAQAVAIGAPLAAAAPMMAPAVASTLANPYVAGGLNAYFGAQGINEFSDPNSYTRKSMSRAYDDPTGSNIGDAAWDVGMNSLNFVGLPFSKAIKGSKNLINNAYKINPYAFKPNPKAYYRMIGEEGYVDALNTGIVRPPQTTRIFDQGSQKYMDIPIAQYDEAYYNAQYPLDRRWYPNSIKKINPNKSLQAKKTGYKGPYMAEVIGDSHLFEKGENVAAYTGPNSSQTVTYSKEHIPIINPNLKFYKEHWLKGYKEVPKQLPGSPNVDFSKYLTQEEAIAARAERLISQKNKPGWNEQLTPELEQRLSTAVERHNPASDYPGEKLGSNTMGRTATEVSKDANLSGIPLNEANKARIAAHETGHYYSNSPAEGAEWLKPFNLNKLESYKTKTYLRGKNRSANYANEIRERAAQLKDYIAQKNGIPLNQDFKITQVQLDDAIKNYVKDTGLDNTMSKMLGALNDKKGLLKTMNKYALGTVPVIIGAETLQQKKQGGTSNDYLELDLTPEEVQRYKEGGYVVEEIDNYQDGGDNKSNGETYKYLGRPDSLYKKSLNGRWSISNKSTGDRFVYIEDPKGSRTKELNKNAVTVSSLNKKRRDHLIKLHKEINFPKEFVDLKDTRTIRATTGEKINPNVDLKADKYNKVVIDNIIKKSKAVGVDPSTMLAIALQETNFGKKDANLGHALYGDTAYPYGYIDFYKEKLNEAKRAKIDNELLQIQYYNGLGTVYPETEEDYHGFKMQKIYGVPLPASGINMRKNPLYGKQIVDLRDNVVLKNPYIQKALKEKKQGGTTNDYVDADLTPKEIKDLIAQGYVIEELN